MSQQARIRVLCAVAVIATHQALAQSQITVLSDPDRKPQGPLSRQIREIVGNLDAEPVARIRADLNSATWEILHATNRAIAGRTSAGLDYGNGEGPLSYGRSLVVISRTAGRLSPAAERRATTTVPRPWFHNRLNELLETAADRDLLVFVHGFNVNFDSAVLRAAQIASDMPFNGAIVCYAWPSQGGIRNYSRDEAIVQRTATPLASFLSNLAQSVGSRTRINILVNSMGNRAVLAALSQLPQTVQQRRPFRHVVFAAPDVSAARFHTQVAAVTKMAQQVTLYACSGDTALKASRQLHRDPNRPWIRIERAGDSTKPVVTAGVQTIDVSAVDTSFMGHSYYGSNKTVLTDLLYLLKRDRQPDHCPWLQPASIRSGTYWKMDKRQVAILPVRQKR